MQKYKLQLLLSGILLLALGLRLWGINFGLPNLYHPDEDAVVMPALTMIKTGNLEPTRMEYGTFHIYLLAAVSALTFVQSARNGFIEFPADLSIYERGAFPAVANHPEYFVAARLVSVMFGMGIVLALYMLAARLGNRRQGLMAAALAAVLPALVTHSHFATTDTALTFWSLLGLYLLVRVFDRWEQDSLWPYAGAGLVCGLAASTKYNGVALAVPLLALPFLKAKKLDDLVNMRTLAGPIAMGAGFLMGTPYVVLNLPKFLYWFGYSLRLYNSPAQNIVGTSWQWHLNYHISSPNAFIFFAGLVGFLLSWRHWGWSRALLVNSFVMVLWLAIVSQTRREARMWLPSAPIFVAWAALLLDWLLARLDHFSWTLWVKRVSGSVLFLLIFLPLLFQSTAVNQRLNGDDVRSQTQRWIESNLSSGTGIAMEYFSPNVDTAVWPVLKVQHLHHNPPEWYREQGVQYLVLSEAGNNSTKMSAEDVAARESFTAANCLVESFSGSFLSAETIHMWVYHLPPCN